MKPYKSISCDVYDKYEIYAMSASALIIHYLDQGKPSSVRNITIHTLETRNKEEFMILSDGKIIRLDHILSVEEYSSIID